MKKKALLIFAVAIVLFVMTFGLAGCENYQLVDVKYTFNSAVITLSDETKEVKISQWKDYDGEQLQVKLSEDLKIAGIQFKSGDVLLISNYNCILRG